MDESNSYAQWLDYLPTLNAKEIDMGLQRSAQVLAELHKLTPFRPALVITVAGTNGKGSTVSFIESMLLQLPLNFAGIATLGCYTSPPLQHRNECYRIDGEQISAQALVDCFAKVERARLQAGDVALTEFEFFSLAALQLMLSRQLPIWLLEVGLGGRLDTVNVIDADIAVLTNVDLDHQSYLGDTVAEIAVEKLGICRPHKTLVCGMANPPAVVAETAADLQLQYHQLHRDFSYTAKSDAWLFSDSDSDAEMTLPMPRMQGEHQLANAATALLVVREAMRHLKAAKPQLLRYQPELERALGLAVVAGRIQCERFAGIELIFDVAHNQASAAALQNYLATLPSVKTTALFSVLADKDAVAVAQALAGDNSLINQWQVCGLSGARGQTALQLHGQLQGRIPARINSEIEHCISAFDALLSQAKTGERIVVFGSFQLVAPILIHFNSLAV